MKRLAKELSAVEQEPQAWSLAASRAGSGRLASETENYVPVIAALPEPEGYLQPPRSEWHAPQLTMLQPSTTSEWRHSWAVLLPGWLAYRMHTDLQRGEPSCGW
jgi:hypothetical protein